MKKTLIPLCFILSFNCFSSFVSFEKSPHKIYPDKKMCESNEGSKCFVAPLDYFPEYYEVINNDLKRNETKYQKYLDDKLAEKNEKESLKQRQESFDDKNVKWSKVLKDMAIEYLKKKNLDPNEL